MIPQAAAWLQEVWFEFFYFTLNDEHITGTGCRYKAASAALINGFTWRIQVDLSCIYYVLIKWMCKELQQTALLCLPATC